MAEIHIQDELPNSAANQTPYTDEDEISLIDIMAVLWKFRALIGIITGGVTLFILLFTFIAAKIPGEKSYWPNEYTSKAIVRVNEASSLNSEEIGKKTVENANLAKFLCTSESLYTALAKDEDFEKKHGRTVSQKNFSNSFSDSTAILTISYKDVNPEVSKEVVDMALNYINEKLIESFVYRSNVTLEEINTQMAVLSESIEDLSSQLNKTAKDTARYSIIENEFNSENTAYKKLSTQKDFLTSSIKNTTTFFSVYQPSEVPENPSGPARTKTVLIVIVAAFLISILTAFVINTINNIKNAPEIIKKFQN